jgi:hypothetical protein
MLTHLSVISSVAKDLIAAGNRHEIRRFAQDDNAGYPRAATKVSATSVSDGPSETLENPSKFVGYEPDGSLDPPQSSSVASLRRTRGTVRLRQAKAISSTSVPAMVSTR